jgi:DNA-directed RNA polymerase subunit RPC12/RpoP
MPIRFRCAYCNQLLGISRRKAGTVVRCPNCSGQVVVPTLEEAGLSDGPQPAGPGQQLFEGNEIDRLLEGAAGDQPSALAAPPRSSGPAAPSSPAAAATVGSTSAPPMSPAAAAPAPAVSPAPLPAPSSPSAPPNGVWLSPAKATMLSVIAVVALAVAFGVGLVVGLFLQSTR